MARPPSRLGNLLVLGVTLVLLLGAAELIVRLWFGPMFAKRPGFYVEGGDLGWLPAPNLDDRFYGGDYSIAIRTDAQGCRLGKLGEVESSKDLVVLCGDSFTFGWGVSTDETFASYLDELVDARSGHRMRVVNLGVGGYGTIQSAWRLARFMRTIDAARIRAVIMTHCNNDLTDNPAHLAYQIGSSQPTPRKHQNTSPLHVVNMVRYLVANLGDGSEQAGSDQALAASNHDELWSFGTRFVSALPATVRFGKITFPGAAVTAEECDVKSADERRGFTTLQAMLMRESLDQLNCAVKGLGIPVIHELTYTSPAWYEDAVGAMVAGSDACGNRVWFVGRSATRYPPAAPIWNEHSGSHYTPRLNRFWAEEVAALLERVGVLPEDPQETVTRAEMAFRLVRAAHGSDYQPPPATGVFPDVRRYELAAPFIEKLVRDGITRGCGHGRFCPTSEVDRAQLAVLVVSAKHGPGYAPPRPAGIFGDVRPDSWAAGHIEQLYRDGITDGCEWAGGRLLFHPARLVTRGELAAILSRVWPTPGSGATTTSRTCTRSPSSPPPPASTSTSSNAPSAT